MHLHTLLEKRERLRKVADAEVVLGVVAGTRVRYFKVEPLLVAFGVRVYLAIQIVPLQNRLLALATLLDVVCANVLGLSPVKVARLEHRVEYELLAGQALPLSEHPYIVSQFLRLRFRRLELTGLKFLPHILCNQLVLAHPSDVLKHDVEHVFAQLMGVLRRERLKDQLIER